MKGLAALASLMLSMLVFSTACAGEYLQLQIRLSTTLSSSTQTNKREITATCVLSTNDWYISGQFLRNARVEHWLIGTNVLEKQVINDSMYLKQAKDFISEKIGTKPPVTKIGRYPPKGYSFMRTNSWLEPFGYGEERAVWLAFCSSTFLATTGRQIPLPLGDSSRAQGCVDKTVLLEDAAGLPLPKTVDLFGRNGKLFCHYEVLASTNVLGRTIPLGFRLIQYEADAHRVYKNPSKSILLGEITSISPRETVPELNSTRNE